MPDTSPPINDAIDCDYSQSKGAGVAMPESTTKGKEILTIDGYEGSLDDII